MKDRLHNLLEIYFKRKDGEPLTEEEQCAWDMYREQNPNEEIPFDKKALAMLARYQEKMASWEKFKQKYHIEFPMAFPDDAQQPAIVQSIRQWPTYRFLTVAASLVGVMLATWLWFSLHKNVEETSAPTAAAIDLTPGSKKATLSSAGGQNRVEVPAGGEYNIVLPDGTNVWLNAASVFRYPAAFSNSARMVELEEGEAFFQVAKKSPEQPFIVTVKGQKIQALGTQFNVHAYKEEPAVTTTLIEGKVSLSNGKQQKMLKPGQQGIINTKDIAIQQPTSIEDAAAWKNKFFSFHNARLSVIMAQVKRWYDVEEVVYTEPLNDEQFVIDEFPRSAPLKSLLESLEVTRFVRFRVEGRKIYISR